MRIFRRRLRCVHLRAHGLGQPPAHRPVRSPGRRAAGSSAASGLAHGDAPDAPGLGAVEGGDRRAPELAHVEVVDHLVDEVGRVLDEGDVGLDVAGDAEPAEDVLAEAVGGGDRRGVEVGERGGEAAAAHGDLRDGDVGEEDEHVVARPAAGRRRGPAPARARR